MIDFHEIRIDFNKRGDPNYDSKDLNINQYSKNADKLSFNFEEESFQSVVFSAKRNDGEESPKIAMILNPDSHRYEYVFGQDEESNTSTSSWFSYIMVKLLITVYLVNEEPKQRIIEVATKAKGLINESAPKVKEAIDKSVEAIESVSNSVKELKNTIQEVKEKTYIEKLEEEVQNYESKLKNKVGWFYDKEEINRRREKRS